MLESNGVECRPIVAGNFVRNPVVDYFNFEVHGSLDASDIVSDCGLFIGNHHYDITENLTQVAGVVRKVLID